MNDPRIERLLEDLKARKLVFEEAARTHPALWHELLVPAYPRTEEGWWERFLRDIYYERVVLAPSGESRVLERPADLPGNEQIIPSLLGVSCERYTGDLSARPVFDMAAGLAFESVKALSMLADPEGGPGFCLLCEPGRAAWVELVYETARMYPVTCSMSVHTFGDLEGERAVWSPDRAAAAGMRTPNEWTVSIQRSTSLNVFALSAKVLELWLEPPRPVEVELPVPINMHRLIEGGQEVEQQAVRHPTWDEEARELRWGSRVVKKYSKPAENQTAILAAFEELGWPRVMDDPLPGKPGIEATKQLGDTVRALHKNMLLPLVEFFRDGTGERVCWRKVN